ncbi:MAG: ABC transporter ATP-binding protein [Clostridia bacterium]|nr:ABC transporter ATP-binding protein [Clostridia bacterium]
MNKVTSRLKQKMTQVMYIIQILKKTKYGNKYMALRIFNMVCDSLFPLILMVIPGLIINELSSGKLIYRLIVFVLILCLYPILNHIKDLTIGLYLGKLEKEISREFEISLHSYIADMDYSSLESPEIAIQTNRILDNAPNAPIDVMNLIINFCRSVIGVISIIAIISYLDPLVIIFLVLFVIANYFVNKKKGKLIYEHGVERSKLNLFFWSDSGNLSDPAYGKEMRAYGLKDFFVERYKNICSRMDDLQYQKDRNICFTNTFNVIVGALQQALLYFFPIYKVLSGNMEIGTMTIFISAGNQFASCINGITKGLLDISNYCMHIDEIQKFMGRPSMQDSGGRETPSFGNDSIIEFKNVSFVYPGSETLALQNINIRIPCNQKLCIVGENGSGKSTFIKLLLGLYEPTSGVISLDGKDIKSFDRKKYIGLFAPVFQDYAKYSLPLSLNIALEESYSNEQLEEAVEKSGLSELIMNLSKGLNTYVGKRVDESGFEPSGGEGQKMAIARAIYHDRPIYLLDEPTAALDPIAEHEIYSTFTRVMKARTTVFTTHRMSAVKLADKLAVFKNGQIIEYGSHSELLAKDGIYAEMFNMQARLYRDSAKQ